MPPISRIARRASSIAREPLPQLSYLSTAAFTKSSADRADAERRNSVRSLIRSAIAAPFFDGQVATTLATRERFADAAALLTRWIEWPGTATTPLQIICEAQSDQLLALRLAHGFGLFKRPVHAGGNRRVRCDEPAIEIVCVDRDWLRERAPTCEHARTCLALMGDSDWGTAGVRERAGLILHHLVRARRS